MKTTRDWNQGSISSLKQNTFLNGHNELQNENEMGVDMSQDAHVTMLTPTDELMRELNDPPKKSVFRKLNIKLIPRRISLKAQRPGTIRNIPNCRLCETGCEDPKIC